MHAKPVPLFVIIAALLWSCAVEAAPISVRLIEGNFRGFLVVRSPAGAAIAYGEVSPNPTGSLVECRMILRFKGGSLYDESATFSQKGVFRLKGYRPVRIWIFMIGTNDACSLNEKHAVFAGLARINHKELDRQEQT